MVVLVLKIATIGKDLCLFIDGQFSRKTGENNDNNKTSSIFQDGTRTNAYKQQEQQGCIVLLHETALLHPRSEKPGKIIHYW